MNFDDILEKIYTEGYTPVHQEVPKKIFPNHIFDENESVKWNKDQVEAYMANRKSIIHENYTKSNNVYKKFQTDLMTYVEDEYDISKDSAEIIVDYVINVIDPSGYTDTLSVVSEMAEVASRIVQFEKLKNKEKE